jgi:hypothetical protein
MPQAGIKLNLLRSSRRQPKLSAHACLHGAFDFNQSPLAPPGTRVVVQVTPNQRQSMAPHGVDGWYVGPSTQHYRCHKCYIPTTFGICDALTVDWFPHKVPFPKVGTGEYLPRQTATDMLTLLQGTQAQPLPSLTYGSPISNAYIQIAKILKQATALPLPMNQPETLVAPPVPEQRVPIVQLSALEQRVQPPSAPHLLAPAPNPPNSVATKKALPQSHTGLPRQSRHTIWRSSRYAHEPLTQSAVAKPYAHHIAALITTPPTAGKQGSIKKLLRGPDATIWEHGLANGYQALH